MKYPSFLPTSPKQVIVTSVVFSLCLCLLCYWLALPLLTSKAQSILLTRLVSLALALPIIAGSTAFLYQWYHLRVLTKSQANSSLLQVMLVEKAPNSFLKQHLLGSRAQIHHYLTSKTALGNKRDNDIVFINTHLSNDQGATFIRLLREKEQESTTRLPVIAVGEYQNKTSYLQALEKGFDDFLPGPVQQEALLEMLDRWLPQKGIPQREKKHNKSAMPIQASLKKPTPCVVKKEKIFDSQAALAACHHNHDLACEMFVQFIAQLADSIPKIKQHWHTKDWSALYHLNHQLYGGCHYCGAVQLQAICQVLEKQLYRFSQTSQGLEPSDIDAKISRLLDAIEALCQWHEAYDIAVVIGKSND